MHPSDTSMGLSLCWFCWTSFWIFDRDFKPAAKMQNEEGQNMDLYIPRKWYVKWSLFCDSSYNLTTWVNHYEFAVWIVDANSCFACYGSSATNRLITAKDHASVQINVGHLDANGMYTGQFTTFALCGFIRAQVLHYACFSFDLFFPSWLCQKKEKLWRLYW